MTLVRFDPDKRPDFVPGERREPYSLNEVLKHELRYLRPSWLTSVQVTQPMLLPDTGGTWRWLWRKISWLFPASATHSDIDCRRHEETRAANLGQIYSTIHQNSSVKGEGGGLNALCLSGGGIRSATFNLGVLQALAANKLLGQFDYLSSVSGGGYIASWLRTWMAREPAGQGSGNAAAESVLRKLGTSSRDPVHPEPEPVRNLRKFSNYLTPRLGLFSGDTWAAAAIVIRNIILNWLVIVPLIASAIALPLAFLVFVKSSGYGSSLGRWLLVSALVLELLASITVHVFRRAQTRLGQSEAFFVIVCAIPIWIAATLLAWAALELQLPWLHTPSAITSDQQGMLVLFSLLWCVVIPLVGWILSMIVDRLFCERQPDTAYRRWWIEGPALALSGLVAAPLLVAMVVNWLADLHERPALFVMLATPLLLALYLVSRTLFVGMTSAIEGKAGRGQATAGSTEDADREWWARLSGWLLLMVTTWLVVTGIVFLSGYLLERFDEVRQLLLTSVSGMGGIAGMIAALIAKGEDVPATDEEEKKQKQPKPAPKWGLRFAVPIFIVTVIVLIGWLTMALGEALTGAPAIFDIRQNPHGVPQRLAWQLGWFTIGMSFSLLLLAGLAGTFVNVNRFSLHAMYRNRLVRAYLGASNIRIYGPPSPNSNTNASSNANANSNASAPLEELQPGRRPDPFTGFDPRDNCKLYQLWVPGQATRPLPIINTTLNLTEGREDLAWQERKAESFSMTPFFCGNYLGGYRPTYDYAGPRGGISVGTAISISGAAASPNMGYSSSPALSFLMTLLNVRLGVWLGNTNETGEDFYRRPGPGQALRPLLNELLGRTNRSGRYVSLSDGGHFDNLGLYEVVLRRCRHVLVSDAGQDENFAFEDLGNAIRKVRIDFGVPITFKHKILIGRRDDATAPGKDSSGPGIYCAVAEIDYGRIDAGAQPGTIVYIKPTVAALPDSPIPYDVYSYWRQDSNFPHQPTSDQWFSESQFESYRALGEFIVNMLCRGVSASGGAPPASAAPASAAPPSAAPASDIEKFVTGLASRIADIDAATKASAGGK